MGHKSLNITGKVAVIAMSVFCIAGMFTRCASTAAPLGGPKDSLPPLVVRMVPEDMTTDFTGRRIFIEFDEYVQIKNLQKEFYVSPSLKRTPTVTVRGRGIQIDINPLDTLAENTTYAFNFGSSIVDNNEGNPLNGLRYVMSTGPEVDSLIMSGYVVDAFTKDSVPKAFMFFYEAWRDSVPEYDSLLFKAKPDVIGRTETNGIFFTQNLKPVPYRVYAVDDKNGNKTYEPGDDMVAFLDSVFDPSQMEGFSIRYDTALKYMVADPQLYFRAFTDETFSRQYLSEASRPLQHKMVILFGAPYPEIENIKFDSIDMSNVVVEYLRPERDSIALWFNVPSVQLPDTIKGEITFMRHDSLNVLQRATVPIKGGWKLIESNDQRREREKLEKEIQKKIEQGEVPPRLPNPFRYNVAAANPLNPENNITITFDYPLVGIDSARISLVRIGEGDAMYKVPATIRQDTANIRKWTIKAPWIAGSQYKLEIPDSVFIDVAGQANDTLRSQFTVMDPEKFGKIIVNVKGKTDSSKYVLQLTDKRNALLQEIKDATTGTYNFLYIAPGDVRLRVVEDVNGNGKWDKGNLVERRQPERVEIYTDTDNGGGQDMVSRLGWTNELNIDMNEMFAPVTMESTMEYLRLKEQIRIKKMLEKLEAQGKQKDSKQGSQQRQQGGSFNPTQGFGL